MMLRSTMMVTMCAGLLMAAASQADAPAGAPAGATGMCRDGSYWTGPTKKGACHGHKGVQDWYASADASAGAAPSVSSPTAPPAAAPAAAPAPAATAKTPAPSVAAAPGGGPGQVWVNTSSKVYHCPTDKWYGKTKNGAYMTEADAIAKGNHADHGKACSK
jgi:hypothetical protein